MRFLSRGRKRAPDRRRDKPRGARRRVRRFPAWRVRYFAAAGLVLAACAGGAWLWHDGFVQRQTLAAMEALHAVGARAGLKVDDVLVEGRARTARETVLETLAVQRDLPIFAFDPHAAKARLEALPWVFAATVERRLPNVIHVRLDERVPLALWQNQGRLAVIDRTGAPIAGAAPEAFAGLPLLVGEDAPEHAAALLEVLRSEPNLGAMVYAAVRVRGRRWNVRLTGGIDVRLPEADPAGAWSKLAHIEREHDLLQRDVTMIDLRVPDRLVVRTAPGGEET